MGQELTMDLLPPERPQVVRVMAENGELRVAVVQGLLNLVKAWGNPRGRKRCLLRQ
eukprot:symbB.v1.2.040047.t1/scaffold6953.1/size14296/1